MSVLAQVDLGSSVENFVQTVGRVLPQVLTFLVILIVGYFVAKVLSKAISKVLDRVGFNKAVERGGVRKALEKSRYDASDILGKLAFYAVLLFVLQLAFGVFGPNPISDLITGVIAYLPKLFVAVVIVVLAAAIAAAVKEIVEASLGGLSYGRMLAFAASTAILVIGGFAALSQLQIAQPIVVGLFYAILAIVVGSAVISIGVGGIPLMREQLQKAASKVEEEAPKLKEEAQGSKEAIAQRAQMRKQQAQGSTSDGDDQGASASGQTVRLPEQATSSRPRQR